MKCQTRHDSTTEREVWARRTLFYECRAPRSNGAHTSSARSRGRAHTFKTQQRARPAWEFTSSQSSERLPRVWANVLGSQAVSLSSPMFSQSHGFPQSPRTQASATSVRQPARYLARRLLINNTNKAVRLDRSWER